MPPKRAKRGDWKTAPLGKRYLKLPFTRSMSAEEWDILRVGSIPRDMDDRWFVYEARGVLHFHRSWTGLKVYEAHFSQRDGRMVPTEVRVQADPKQYEPTDLEQETRQFESIIDILLARCTPHPSSEAPRPTEHDAESGEATTTGIGPLACFKCEGSIRPGEWMAVHATQLLRRNDAGVLVVEYGVTAEQVCSGCADHTRVLALQAPEPPDVCARCGSGPDRSPTWIHKVACIDLLSRQGEVFGAARRRLESFCPRCSGPPTVFGMARPS